MENDHKGSSKFTIEPHPDKSAGYKRRKEFNPVVRFIIIGSWGAILACIASYGLKKIGY